MPKSYPAKRKKELGLVFKGEDLCVRDMVQSQLVEDLPRMHKTLGSSPHTI